MRRVRNYLSSIGITVWTDESLEPGTPTWTFAIDQEIRRASAMVVVLSPDAKASPWVENEVALAQTCGTRIFPLLARGDESTAISFRLIAYQYVDARTVRFRGWPQLCSGIWARVRGRQRHPHRYHLLRRHLHPHRARDLPMGVYPQHLPARRLR